MRTALAVPAAITAVALSTQTAWADWPAARHDARRTAVAAGKSNIQKPAVAWRAYLGGSLTADALLTADVEGTGKNDFVIASGGSISAVRPDGTVVWKTRTSGNAYLLGIVDLNGDGKKEVVAHTGLGALALDLKSGAVAWQQPNGEMGSVSYVRMADMNGDGLPDLVVGECMSCGGGKTSQPGFIYSFAGGFSSPGRVPIPFPSIVLGPEASVVNLDGKGGAELVAQVQNGTMLAAVDGVTAKTIATSANLNVGTGYVVGCAPAKHAADPGSNLICVLSPGADPSPSATDPSRVFAVTLNPAATPGLAQVWSVSLAPKEAISGSAVDLFVDLAGDGNFETLITGRDATGAHTVHVLQASTGKELGTIPGSLLGTAPVLAGGGRIVMTQGADNTVVALWSFSGGAAKSLGTIQGDGAVVSPDWPLLAVASAGILKPIVLDANGDGAPDVFTYVHKTGQFLGFTPGKVPPPQIGAHTFPVDTPLTAAWPLPPMDQPYPQIGLLQADGTLHLMNNTFGLTSASIRVGGFYWNGGFEGLGTSPVVASLDGGPAQVLAADRLGAFVRLDASKATPDTSPVTSFRSPDSKSPVVVQGLDGSAAGIFLLHIIDPSASPQAYTVRRLHADGSVAWEVPVQGTPREDLVTGHFDNDGVPDVAFQAGGSDAMKVTTFALSGADGHTLWATTVDGCSARGGISSYDWNGDGVDDVLQQGGSTVPGGSTQVLSGVNGAQLAKGGPDDCFFLAMPHDIDGDGKDELVYTSGLQPEAVYSHDLTTKLYVSTEDDRPFPYGTIADCPDGPTQIQGSAAFPSRLKLIKLGASPITSSTIFLVGGQLYHDAMSANAAGSAQLTAVNIHQDLTGNGNPTAVVGSADGWLYAVDPCTGELTFAYDFQAPVGEPVFGDTDGDGLDEIVVDVDDGYIYALHNEVSTTTTSSSTGSSSSGAGSSSSGAGGSGGGGAGTGGSSGPWVYVYGRASCCGVAGPALPAGPAALVFAAGLLAVGARRRRARR